MEIVHDGWLLKSPPPKRLWGAKWRNRWFVLRAGDLPGQYFLEYYTDETRKKLKGKIDLDQCGQVDAGITFAQRKFEYKFMFDLKTPKRVYYLCAETEEAMNRWVDCVCQVCGLRMISQEDMVDNLSPPTPLTPQLANSIPFDSSRLVDLPPSSCVESPPPSACSTTSGPYIPISECITGRKTGAGAPLPDLLMGQNTATASASSGTSSTTRFPFAFSKQEDLHAPSELAPPAPRGGSVWRRGRSDEGAPHSAPPRPPKPARLSESQQTYMNLNFMTNYAASSRPVEDETPRASSATAGSGVCAPTVDRGLKPRKTSDINSHSASDISPMRSPPDDLPSASMVSTDTAQVPPSSAPPIVDRNLKPHKKMSEPALATPFVLEPAPRPRSKTSARAAPSPTPRSARLMATGVSLPPPSDTDSSSLSSPNSRRDSFVEEQVFFPLNMVQRRSSHEIQYLDLDLESQSTPAVAPSASGISGGVRGGLEAAKGAVPTKIPSGTIPETALLATSVVYKKVDFVKTEAFNKMRQNVEEGYRTGKSNN